MMGAASEFPDPESHRELICIAGGIIYMIPLHFATVLNKKKLFGEHVRHFFCGLRKADCPSSCVCSPLFRGAGASFVRAQGLLKRKG